MRAVRAEDMPAVLAAIEAAVVSKSLGAFLTEEDQTASTLRDAGLQVKRAQRFLAKNKVDASEYHPLDGGNGVTARRECVAEAVRVLDARARSTILAGLKDSQELREYLLPHKTAAVMWKALPLFFGGVSQEAQLNVKALLKDCKYTFNTDGQGARALVQKVVALGKRLEQAGGTHTDADVMQTVISKFVLLRDREDVYRANTVALLRDLNKNTLTVDALRQELIQIEQRAEAEGTVGEPEPDGKVMTTSSSSVRSASAFTPAQLAELRAEFKEQGQAMATSIDKGFKALAKDFRRKDKDKAKKAKSDKPCFSFRDTGDCARGDECRFAH